MIKMILSDMDGTLLDNDGKMPPDFDEVMAMLKERGVLFVPASGRQYTAIVNQMPKYKDDFVFIAENGGVAVYKGQSLVSSPIDKESIRHLIEKTDSPEIFPVLCGKDCSYVEKKWEPYLSELEKFLTHYHIVDNLLEILEHKDIIKIAFGDCLHAQAEERLFPMLMAAADPGLKVILSSNYWIDVLNEGINKGSVLKGLQQKLGISADECAAFGDYLNDIEMLKAVKYGYAMANAHPEVITSVNLFAPANNKNGVMRTIRSFAEKGLI